MTKDGGDWKLGVYVKKKEVVKKSARGRKKTRVAANEDGYSSESCRGDVCVKTSKDAGWMDDCRLNPGLVRDAQKKYAVIGFFLKFKKKGDKSEWNDISAQGQNTGLNGEV